MLDEAVLTLTDVACFVSMARLTRCRALTQAYRPLRGQAEETPAQRAPATQPARQLSGV